MRGRGGRREWQGERERRLIRMRQRRNKRKGEVEGGGREGEKVEKGGTKRRNKRKEKGRGKRLEQRAVWMCD